MQEDVAINIAHLTILHYADSTPKIIEEAIKSVTGVSWMQKPASDQDQEPQEPLAKRANLVTVKYFIWRE
jgi:predicted CoA-binding protein